MLTIPECLIEMSTHEMITPNKISDNQNWVNILFKDTYANIVAVYSNGQYYVNIYTDHAHLKCYHISYDLADKWFNISKCGHMTLKQPDTYKEIIRYLKIQNL